MLYLVAATYEHRRVAVRAIAAVLATLLADATLVYPASGGFLWHGGLAIICLSLIIAWSIGYIVRQRRRYAVSLQDEAASKAVAVERLRIARELHDVVAHSMSVIAVQAGYGQYVIDSQPADARDALGAIQMTSREALEEMRRMLGALRQADEAERPDGRRGGCGPARLGPGMTEAGGSPAVSRARAGRPGPAARPHRQRRGAGRRDARADSPGTCPPASTCPLTGSCRRR